MDKRENMTATTRPLGRSVNEFFSCSLSPRSLGGHSSGLIIIFNSEKFGHDLHVFLRHPEPKIDVDRCVM